MCVGLASRVGGKRVSGIGGAGLASVRPGATVPFVHRLTVRYADTDAQGHVFFANAYTYMDEGLTALLAHMGLPYPWLEKEQGVICVFAASSCQHRSRILFGQAVEVGVTVARLGRTSFTTRYVLTQSGGGVCAEGQLTSVCLDPEARTPVRIPTVLRRRLAEHLLPEGGSA